MYEGGVEVKKTSVATVALSIIVICVLSNEYSFHHAKQSCIKNDKTPTVEKAFLSFHWSVSCK